MRIESNTAINKAAINELKNNRYAALNSEKKRNTLSWKKIVMSLRKKLLLMTLIVINALMQAHGIICNILIALVVLNNWTNASAYYSYRTLSLKWLN